MRCLALLLLLPVSLFAQSPSHLEWSELAPLPPAPGESVQPGVAGPFAGSHQGMLVVAGGANFPRGMPWTQSAEGHAPPKIYHDDIFVLSAPDAAWQASPVKLPRAIGYGVAVSMDAGILCMGGEWKTEPVDGKQELHRSDEVYLITVDPKVQTVEIVRTLNGKPLPRLPVAITAQTGAVMDQAVYLAGGDAGTGATRHFWRMNLVPAEGDALAWEELVPWPGPPRVLAVSAVQSDGINQRFHLFSGRNPRPGGMQYLADGYAFADGAWRQLGDITIKGRPRCIMAGTAAPAGSYGILAFGGADGAMMKRLLALEAARDAREADSAEWKAAEEERLAILNNHPGFSTDVLAYTTVTDAWSVYTQLPRSSPVTTAAVSWNGDYVIPSGEISPGIRSAGVLRAIPVRTPAFGRLDQFVLGGYLLLIILNGMYFARRMHSTDDFFKAGQRIPWWAAGLSIFGTQLSAITFMAVPGNVFATDWRRFIATLCIVGVAPFIVLFFLPFYRRLNVTTAYEYLEQRFNLAARLLGSLMFIILQFGRIGIVLLLPSIALSTVTGMSVNTCILLMGVLCVVYTTLGGMEAVIWTDVVQVIILMGGALLALLLMPVGIEGGWNALNEVAAEGGKFRLIDLRWDFADATFFVMLAAGMGQNLISYGSDQSVIQRYLTTPDEKQAARGIWTNALLSMPASLLFLSIGSLLFAFYKLQPEAMDPMLPKVDALFPLYIISQLPAGVAGLVIAAVFAASMSSLDSSMNSVSATVTTDFYRRANPDADERTALVLARTVVIVVGLLGTLFALWMAQQSNIKSLWDTFAEYIGLFGGGLGGLFMLGMFTRRPSGSAAVIGLVISGLFQYWLKNMSGLNIHPWLYSATGLLSCLVAGYLAGLALPNRKDDQGLTVHTW